MAEFLGSINIEDTSPANLISSIDNSTLTELYESEPCYIGDKNDKSACYTIDIPGLSFDDWVQISVPGSQNSPLTVEEGTNSALFNIVNNDYNPDFDLQLITYSDKIKANYIFNSKPSQNIIKLLLETTQKQVSRHPITNKWCVGEPLELLHKVDIDDIIITDADGNTINGEIDISKLTEPSYGIDDVTNFWLITITIPQSFLDTAVYPLTVDPTLIGTSNYSWCNMMSMQQKVARASDGTLVIATGDSASHTGDRIRIFKKSPGGSWTEINGLKKVFSNGSGKATYVTPCIAFDRNDVLHVATCGRFSSDYYTSYYNKIIGLTGDSPYWYWNSSNVPSSTDGNACGLYISGSNTTSHSQYSTYPSMAIAGDVVHLVHHQYSGGYRSYYNNIGISDTSFANTHTQLVSEYAAVVDIAVDGASNLFVTYTKMSSPYPIKYTYKTPTGSWTSPTDISSGNGNTYIRAACTATYGTGNDSIVTVAGASSGGAAIRNFQWTTDHYASSLWDEAFTDSCDYPSVVRINDTYVLAVRSNSTAGSDNYPDIIGKKTIGGSWVREQKENINSPYLGRRLSYNTYNHDTGSWGYHPNSQYNNVARAVYAIDNNTYDIYYEEIAVGNPGEEVIGEISVVYSPTYNSQYAIAQTSNLFLSFTYNTNPVITSYVWHNEGEVSIGETTLKGVSSPTIYLGLYTNKSSLGESDTLGDITEVSGAGYSRIALNSSNWIPSSNKFQYPILTFTSGEDWGVITGYFLCTVASGITGKLLGSQHFDEAITVNKSGVELDIELNVYFE